MELRVITKLELESFVQSDLYKQFEDLPISPARARAQSKNPAASPDDPLLVIALSNQQVIAYFGMLPDKLQAAKDAKVCWSTGWWVHPEKGRTAGMKVFYKALQLWNKQMLFDELPEVSYQVLKRIGGFAFKEVEGVHCFIRFKSHKIIPRKIPQLQFIEPILKSFDSILNVARNLILKPSKNKDYELEHIFKPDEESLSFIQSHQTRDFAGLEANSIHWIVNNPWLTSDEEKKQDLEKRYYFSGFTNKFEYHFLKIFENQKLVAVLWLSWRDGTVKTPYLYFDEGMEELVWNAILDFLISSNVHTFICFHPAVVKLIKQKRTPFYHVKLITKKIGLPEDLLEQLENYQVIQDGNGDVVFT